MPRCYFDEGSSLQHQSAAVLANVSASDAAHPCLVLEHAVEVALVDCPCLALEHAAELALVDGLEGIDLQLEKAKRISVSRLRQGVGRFEGVAIGRLRERATRRSAVQCLLRRGIAIHLAQDCLELPSIARLADFERGHGTAFLVDMDRTNEFA